jgi:hypothetical protein
MRCNATVYRIDAATGEEVGMFVAEVDSEGRMLRASGLQNTGREGTPVYDDYIRRTNPGFEFRVVRDGCRGFIDHLARLALPPAYRR